MATGSIIKDIAKAAKAKAVRGVSSAVFGRGLIGGALGKSFEKKFGDQEEENTDVANALKEQESVQDDNNATLTRIETIVMNIADNIYNIAGVLNAQVVSMKEAHRLQQERAFKSAAAAEEANAEALKVDAPSPSASTTENTTKEKKGGITDLIGSVLNTKNLFKGFLKKFAIFAAGAATIALAGFAASTMMSKKDAEIPQPPTQGGAMPAGPSEPQIISSTPPSAPSGGNSIPSAPAAPTQSSAPTPGTVQPPPSQSESTPPGNVRPLAPQSESVSPGNVQPPPPQGESAPQPTKTPTSAVPSAPTSTPAPTPAAPPPSVAASAPAKDPEMAKLEDYFNKPENAAERAQLVDVAQRQTDIKEGIRATKELMQGPQTPEEKTRNESILKILEPRLEATKKEKKAILDKARQSVQQTSPAPAVPSVGGGAASSGGGEAGGATLSAGGGSSAPGPAATSGGGGGGASPVPSTPSSGASIGTASTSVAAASESTPPKVSSTQINNDTTSGDTPPPTAIPSPIAGRGSLDYGTVFDSGS